MHSQGQPLSNSSERAERGRDGLKVNGNVFPLEAVQALREI